MNIKSESDLEIVYEDGTIEHKRPPLPPRDVPPADVPAHRPNVWWAAPGVAALVLAVIDLFK
jgi:hypothetical protein